MKRLRVTAASGSVAEFDAATFFDRYRHGADPARLTLGADAIESVELVEAAERGIAAPQAEVAEQ